VRRLNELGTPHRYEEFADNRYRFGLLGEKPTRQLGDLTPRYMIGSPVKNARIGSLT
jgi:hypothetical protein